MRHLLKTSTLSGALLGLSMSTALAVDLEFYFPVAVGGDAAATIQAMTEEYMSANPDVNINAIYTGSYADTTTRAITAARGGNPPHLAILSAVDVFMLIDEDLIETWDQHLSEEELKNWVGGFYDAFRANTHKEGKTWGIPFQRSTPVMYYNKDAFKEAGLDPESPPATWEELVEMGKKLTVRDDSGNATQWGIRIPSSGFPYWPFQALAIANGAELMNEAGTEVYFDQPAVVEALEFFVDLSKEHEIMAPGIVDWGATPKAFLDGETAMAITTTGNLTNIRTNATFDLGVAMLPKNKQYGVATGGGDFFLFKGHGEEETRAAIDFVKWATAPEQAAAWSIATGYVAPRPDIWETEKMKAYVEEAPGALVARNQLEHAVAEFSVYENARVRQILNDAIAAAIVGDKTPEQALSDAQSEADEVLKIYRQ
ncbi:ABC transporter substrate-binding protein [Pseudohoeflea coraliihabitans]|uniref:ABC transporter substrate-binding protein n=1 Tax=Pseudohoeflea coraliihabitans TaxID=2860393 RepID=A0ABS6WP49_9HYPH|nr:ABC transporter substrate-binding protein [Pseudohoeflea sp. DP4N28-3]MBW3097182.1 ABC transporter substrate-binding protein [Pseudohoeflea sp. DP4N28-3]